MMYDVQLQSILSGQLLWAQTFTHQEQATQFEADLQLDLDDLDDVEFRRKYGVPLDA